MKPGESTVRGRRRLANSDVKGPRVNMSGLSYFISIHSSVPFKTAHILRLLLGGCWATVNACPEAPSGNVNPSLIDKTRFTAQVAFHFEWLAAVHHRVH